MIGLRGIKQRLRSSANGERGVVSIEFLGSASLLLVAGLIGIQIMLAMHALSQANHAARNGARAEAIAVGTGTPAAYAAVSESLRSGTRATCGGYKEINCTVQIDMPYLGMSWVSDVVPPMTVTRTAHFVRTEPL
ncbi:MULTISPECIES: TadE/TadG family type IV pilus assembly protein [unclassified Brevibacterium]|uniref:TadE/TadG family type IV pilus assembly protein n=1 Tax=unclassified Brevibacterium TaxID=2614124 RepID=UPI0008A1F9DF|nr:MULTISPECIES: TadE family protein [unclassified Brevibacterium]OFL68800.1 hypothetical protein HMPREF2757_07805 [Brevibacterium sp. HMSC063G07]OFS25565.1 hypothetical protein HMPREF3162_08285 [Brevibacterium sp. HMSC07C04]